MAAIHEILRDGGARPGSDNTTVSSDRESMAADPGRLAASGDVLANSFETTFRFSEQLFMCMYLVRLHIEPALECQSSARPLSSRFRRAARAAATLWWMRSVATYGIRLRARAGAVAVSSREPYYLADDGWAHSPLPARLDEVTPRNVNDPVFAAFPCRHRQLVAFVRDLPLVKGGLGRKHVVEWRQAITAARLRQMLKFFP